MSLLLTMGLGSLAAPGTPSAVAFQVLAVENFGTYLVLTFNNNLNVSGPGLDPTRYIFTGPSRVHATAVHVLSPGNLLKISISTQTTGATYAVNLPSQGILDVNGNVLNGAFTHNFVGIGSPVTVQIAKSIDERTLEVVFSEAVMADDAMDVARYTIDPPLEVLGAMRLTDFHYRLKTGPQDIGTSYAVTISPIRGIDGDL